jgi:hypothetical protein
MNYRKATWYVSEDDKRELKAECARQDRDQSSVIRELIRRWLREQQEARRAAGQK